MSDAEKAREGEVWGATPYERMAARNGPMHDHLFAALDVRRSERFADLACGTGPMALRAGRAGADVTALDISPELLETARRLAAEESLTIQFDEGDVEQLPYADASFDVVCSAQGVILAPDPDAVARELARICRPGGRLGLQAWRPEGEGAAYARMIERHLPDDAPSVGVADEWGTEPFVREHLEPYFELEFIRGETYPPEGSGEEIWQTYRENCGPMKWLIDHLGPQRGEELRRDFVAFFEQYREGDAIRAPNEYVLIMGWRRDGAG
jgi:SAM-dependent methyltransferase